MNPDAAILRVLELSAEAQAERREAAQDSPEFHKLTGAVLAYGKVLELLTSSGTNLLSSGGRGRKTQPAALAHVFLPFHPAMYKTE